MLSANPGTILCFEKPDLYMTPSQCCRYDLAWPLGYVDDGAIHEPKKIHSIRIPMPDYAPRLHIHDVKILHYAMLRPAAQAAKYRLYSVIENSLSTGFALTRRRKYDLDYLFNQMKPAISPSPTEWFTGWEKVGIDMQTILNQKYFWHDFEVLKYFHKYGLSRFWIDDIWDFDWESCRLGAVANGLIDIPNFQIKAKPKVLGSLLKALTSLYMQMRKFIK